MAHKTSSPYREWTQQMPSGSDQDHGSPMRLDDFFANPSKAGGGPVNGGGHLYLKLNSENLELFDFKDKAGVPRRAIRGRLIHEGSHFEYHLFNDGVVEEVLDAAVTVIFVEGDENKINPRTTGEQPEDPWTFEIELTEEQFYYVLRLALRVDPFTAKRISDSSQIEVHGDRFSFDEACGYAARLLYVIVDGKPQTNEYAVNRRAFMQRGEVSH